MSSSAPEATRSSRALGRSTGGKSPSAGTVMNAYEPTPSASGRVFVSRYGMVRAVSPRVTTTLRSAVTCATAEWVDGTDTARSVSGPEGFSATASTSTSTVVLPIVSIAGTTTSRATGGSITASLTDRTVRTALARPPTVLPTVYGI